MESDVLTYAIDLFREEIDSLYHPNVYVFRVDVIGETDREQFIENYITPPYYKEHNFKFNGNLYTCIISYAD